MTRRTKRQIEDAILDQASKILEERARYTKGVVMTDVETAKRLAVTTLQHKKQEVFAVMFLDAGHTLLKYEQMFFGTIDGASVYPREVARRAMELNAAAVILTHNHPSGRAVASPADKRITEKCKSSLALFDVRVIDHIVVGATVYSFASEGLL